MSGRSGIKLFGPWGSNWECGYPDPCPVRCATYRIQFNLNFRFIDAEELGTLSARARHYAPLRFASFPRPQRKSARV